MNIVNRIAVFAAGAVVFGTMAFGQGQMTANVPFAFTAANGKAVMPAGEYRMSPQSANGSNLYALLSTASRHQVFAVGTPDRVAAPGSPALLFRCAEDGCALSGIRTYEGKIWSFGRGHNRRGSELAVRLTPVHSSNGD